MGHGGEEIGSGGDWGPLIRGLRLRLTETQESFAERVGVQSRRTINRWENGEAVPDLNRQRALLKLKEELDGTDHFGALLDTVETTGGIATLLDGDFNIIATSPLHQELSGLDVSALRGQPSERYWGEEMDRVMAAIGGLQGYRDRGIRRLDLKLERPRREKAKGLMMNQREFTVGSTISWGPVHKPYAFLTQLRVVVGGEPSPPLIKVAGAAQMRKLETGR